MEIVSTVKYFFEHSKVEKVSSNMQIAMVVQRKISEVIKTKQKT